MKNYNKSKKKKNEMINYISFHFILFGRLVKQRVEEEMKMVRERDEREMK